MPDIFIIAGCNGAGKTTAAYSLLPDIFDTAEFINADEIAKGLSPLDSENAAFKAGRIMLAKITTLIDENKSFAFETTLSGITYLNIIKNAKQKGYRITFFFVYLANETLAKNRVAARVSRGGHNIPGNVIERRYYKGLRNFALYKKLANSWYLYDNSGRRYELIAKCIDDKKEIFNFDLYNILKEYGK